MKIQEPSYLFFLNRI